MKMVEAVPVGISPIGTVIVCHLAGTPDAGGKLTQHRYEVRVGNTLHIKKKTKKAALAVAEALCD